MGRRRFAKKGDDVRHYKLVARGGNDEDEDETPLVLEPLITPGVMRRTGKTEAELTSVPASLDHLGASIYRGEEEEMERLANKPKKASRPRGDSEDVEWGDLDGDCYFPPDGYDYEQHLKSVSGTKKAKSVVGVVIDAPEPVKTEEIMKQPVFNDDEAEVLRALENADEYEELEDEEMEDALASGAVDVDDLLWGPAAADAERIPDMSVFAQHKAILEAMKRDGALDDEEDDFDDGLDDLDDGYAGGATGSRSKPKDQPKPKEVDFAKFMENEYGEDEIGACDEDEIEGHMTLDNCEDVLDEFLDEQKAEREELTSLYEPQRGWKDDEPRVIAETRAIIEQHYMQQYEDEEDDTEPGSGSEDESKTWDCESVLSTLSNVSNRPGKIGRIAVVKKPSALKPVKEQDDSDESEADVVELPDVVTVRPKGETAEEKKARKASVKEMRRVCRRMKKESKETYKQEAAKLPGQVGSADVRQKTRAIRF